MSVAKSPLELLQAAAERHGAGDLPAAELLYRAALHREPHPVGQHLLGVLLHQTGRVDEAVTILAQAAAKLPDDGELLGNYGAALVAANQPAEAALVLDKALASRPSSIVSVLVNRSAARRSLGQLAGALSDALEAIALKPDLASAYSNAGSALQAMGRRSEALECFQRGLLKAPENATLETNVGTVLFMLGRFEEALIHLDRAISLDPTLADAHQNRGTTLYRLNDLAGADASYSQALTLNPNDANALSNQGSLELMRGRVDVALERFEAALAIDPTHRNAGSNSLLALNYLPALKPDFVADLHKAWGAPHLSPPRQFKRRAQGEIHQIGIISPDLWQHPVASFVESWIGAVDSERWQLHLYHDGAIEDAVTERLRGFPVSWTKTAGWPDEQLTSQIRADGIDIVLDLAGHTSENRLLALAERAAPVQMTMIGYPNTTGLPSMDYRITDAIADPPGMADEWHTEKLIRLPGGFLCWAPPPTAPDPMASTGRPLTFGSFNALAKLSSQTISVWAAILTLVPESRLLLKSKALSDPETRHRILRAFSAHRIGANRLELLGWLPSTTDNLGFYAEIDVALDPFPYSGTTTTMEALWMGVPVVTLIGDSHAGRVGASLLTHAGLAEDVASAVNLYIDRAVALARSPELRAQKRRDLRKTVGASLMMDPHRYARALESAWEEALGSAGAALI